MDEQKEYESIFKLIEKNSVSISRDLSSVIEEAANNKIKYISILANITDKEYLKKQGYNKLAIVLLYKASAPAVKAKIEKLSENIRNYLVAKVQEVINVEISNQSISFSNEHQIFLDAWALIQKDKKIGKLSASKKQVITEINNLLNSNIIELQKFTDLKLIDLVKKFYEICEEKGIDKNDLFKKHEALKDVIVRGIKEYLLEPKQKGIKDFVDNETIKRALRGLILRKGLVLTQSDEKKESHSNDSAKSSSSEEDKPKKTLSKPSSSAPTSMPSSSLHSTSYDSRQASVSKAKASEASKNFAKSREFKNFSNAYENANLILRKNKIDVLEVTGSIDEFISAIFRLDSEAAIYQKFVENDYEFSQKLKMIRQKLEDFIISPEDSTQKTERQKLLADFDSGVGALIFKLASYKLTVSLISSQASTNTASSSASTADGELISQLVENSSNLFEKITLFNRFRDKDEIPTTNRIKTQISKNKATPQEIAANARNTHPVVHEELKKLIINFLEYKKKQGTAKEKQVYASITTPEQFIVRCLTKRPLAFCNNVDNFLLRTGEIGQACTDAKDKGVFSLIGTDQEKEPFVLSEYLSYEEMEISALIGMSGPTQLINDGAKGNYGKEGKDGTYQKNGVIVGLVGARLEKEELMEYKYVVVTKNQNTNNKGYGKDGDLEASRKMEHMAIFYGMTIKNIHGIYCFPSYDEVKSDPEKYHCIKVGDRYINKQVYMKRMGVVIETYLAEGNDCAKAAKKQGCLRFQGLGLGVWPGENDEARKIQRPELGKLQLEALVKGLDENNYSHLTDIDFIEVPKDQREGYRKYLATLLQKYKININITFSDNKIASPLNDPNKLLIVNYPWDGNSGPGNEYFWGNLNASNDPVAACASTISELQNHLVNPDAFKAERIRYCRGANMLSVDSSLSPTPQASTAISYTSASSTSSTPSTAEQMGKFGMLPAAKKPIDLIEGIKSYLENAGVGGFEKYFLVFLKSQACNDFLSVLSRIGNDINNSKISLSEDQDNALSQIFEATKFIETEVLSFFASVMRKDFREAFEKIITEYDEATQKNMKSKLDNFRKGLLGGDSVLKQSNLDAIEKAVEKMINEVARVISEKENEKEEKSPRSPSPRHNGNDS